MKYGVWIKARRSNGNGGNNCVEVKFHEHGGRVDVRDSKDRVHGAVLSTTADDWRIFITEVKTDKVAPASGRFQVSRAGLYWRFEDLFTTEKLLFTPSEWEAFVDGAKKGEFDRL